MVVSTPRPTRRELMVFDDAEALRKKVADARQRGKTIGLVPTMGALHAGHLSLMEAARRECDLVVATIFVNPTQFGPGEDFQEYPRPLDADLDACRTAGVDLAYCPSRESMYAEGFTSYVDVEGLSTVLEGKFRPGHFRGVTTIVLKLLNVVQPDVAFFGRKDYQQQVLIRRMCTDLAVPVTIRTCPTIREEDGLALSSRNSYLNAAQRHSAIKLLQCLKLAEERLAGGETNLDVVRQAMRAHLESASDIVVDYATVVHPESLEEITEPLPDMVALVAARVGSTRLIDNLPIHV